jgi:hypothetical protein
MDRFDVLLVVPPLSPSDTNPPLGPHLIRTGLRNAGLSSRVIDLSIRYLACFRRSEARAPSGALGDQDKDRTIIATAREHFLASSPLRMMVPAHLPPGADAQLGMHYRFEEIAEAAAAATARGSFWRDFLLEHVFAGPPPAVLGLSIMGPPQVLVALAAARMCKELWPSTPVVAGGSHITLLAPQIRADSRYGACIDGFLPGHSEDEFVELVADLRRGRVRTPVLRAGSAERPELVRLTTSAAPQARISDQSFELMPTFDQHDLSWYDQRRVTIPLQLTRGCAYGKCAYCTYPAVEPQLSREPDWARAGSCIETLIAQHGVRRFSLKDSFFTPKLLRSFADMLSDRGIAIEWSATTMLHDRLTPVNLANLARLGLRTLEFGLETIDSAGQVLMEKRQNLEMVERVLSGVAGAGVVCVINQIFGWPGQSEENAMAQLEWFQTLCERWPGLIRGSLNMLEINRGAPMAANPEQFGIRLGGAAPWAFSHAWNAPAWGPRFQRMLGAMQEGGPPRPVKAIAA